MITRNRKQDQKQIRKILLLVLMIPTYLFAGEFRKVISYDNKGIQEEKEFYIWSIDQFPIKVCINSRLSRSFKTSIWSAIIGWNQAWGYILGRMLDRNEIKRSQIGVDVPPWNILDEVSPCTKEKSDQAAEANSAHIFITAGKLPINELGRYGFYKYTFSSSKKEYLYKSVIEINKGIDFSFEDVHVPAGKTRLSTVVRHELGHALGLPHNTDFGTLMYYNGNRCRGEGRNECNIKIKDGIHFANLYGYFMNYSESDLVYKSKCRTVKDGTSTTTICYD